MTHGVPQHGLASSERWLFERVTRPAAEPCPAIAAASSAEDASWVQGGRLPALDRLEVYRRGYHARLVECLADDYPALGHALGASEFEALCLDFIESHPPPSASLNFYGAPFAAFCAARPSPDARFASDLARLEWALVEVIHADAESVLDPAGLARLSEAEAGRVRLVPSPASRLLHTTYPVHRYLRAFLDGESPSWPAPEPSSVAVCRRGDDVWRIGVSSALAPLLSQLVAGTPLGSALEAVPASDGDGLQRAFSEWVACGFFSAMVPPTPELVPSSAASFPTRLYGGDVRLV